ncbi:MAG: FAD binding domain-containing protein [Anaerolineales bacterium]|nr:FAD binding domain-containing protein [Anaerolineales bacterium]
MAVKDYHRPTEIQAAAELVHAGAVPLMLSPRPPLEIEAESVVDLSQLGLSYIREEEDGLHIGALTPLQEIAASATVQARANGILSQAAELSAHLGLRHIATLGGALYSNDGPPEVSLALYVLNARVSFLDVAQEETTLATWQEKPAGRVPIAVHLPTAHLRVGGALERIARSPRDAAIVAVAATVTRKGNRTPNIRLAVGHNPSIQVDITHSDEPVTSADQITASLGELLHFKDHAQSDYAASAEYRHAMTKILTQRAIERAFAASTTNNQ